MIAYQDEGLLPAYAITALAVAISISLGFSILYFGLVIVEIINNIAVIKSLQKLVEKKFSQAGNEAKIGDWQIVKDIIEAANFKPEIIEYVENKINHYLIKAREDNKNISDKFIKLIVSVIVITFIFGWNPYNILEHIIIPKELKDLSVSLALISAIIAIIVFMWQLIHTVQFKFEISKFKNCIYFLEQAQLMINYIKNNDEAVKKVK
ncbi:MAG: hypothetical protein KME05_22765 [Gloeocapsa sp. UFS-A4-WI-NPMV-4B04]|nr:hypothetical protein [Gloeocapsa sp. UFS-A4-WI-NPMV-4B04]